MTAKCTVVRGLICLAIVAGAVSGARAQTVPAPWTSADVGNPAVPGRASESSGTFSVTGSGADIWGASDQFHFLYQAVDGDVEIVARVESIEFMHRWSKAGVMIREQLTPGSSHAYMLGSAAKGWAFQRRPAGEGISVHSEGPLTNPPGWVKLTRSGDTFTAYQSSDGSNWGVVGSETIAMARTVYVGLAVTSHSAEMLSTATFTNIVVTVPVPANEPPSVTLLAPAPDSTYTVPATVTFSAAASDTDGTIERVDFYADAQLIGSDTTSPYGATWSNVPAGSHDLTAVAFDDDGASTSSGTARVTVSPPNEPLPPQAVPSIALVQKVGRDAGTTSSTTVTFPASTTAGNFIAVAVRASGVDQVFTVTDSTGNQYLKAAQFNVAQDGVSLGIFYSENIRGGSNTVTVASTKSGTQRVSILEYSGVAASGSLDVTAVASGTGTAPNSGTVTTTTSGALLLGVLMTANPSTVTAGNGFTVRDVVSQKLLVEDGVQQQAGPAAANATLGGSDIWGMLMAAFRPGIAAPRAPSAPASPNPADEATNVGTATSLSWAAPGATAYDVHFGTTSTPPVAATNLTTATYAPSGLADGTTYFWQIVARNSAGTTTGPVWSFTTTAAPPPPPSTPTTVVFNPSPDHDSTVASYVVAIYRGSDPVTATPVATKDLGKPTPTSDDISVDISDIVNPLASGSYYAVVTASGPGGSASSTPSATFAK